LRRLDSNDSIAKEGKVRWIGVSNFNLEEMRQAQAICPITSLQPPYSLVRREVEQEICLTADRKDLADCLFANGIRLLTGAMTRTRAANLPFSDWRSRDVEFHEPRLSKNLALVERLREIGQRNGRPPGQVAIAWTLHILRDRRDRRVTQRRAGRKKCWRCELNLTTKKCGNRGRNTYQPELVTAA